MALKDFEICLEDPRGGFYYPGDTLSGRVLMTLEPKNSKYFKFLQIILIGRAKNSWFEKTENGLVETVDTEEYLNFEAEIELEPLEKTERAEYGFEYELSSGLPSSFSGSYGQIFYKVKAILEGSTTQTISKEFILREQVDLNEIPEATQAVEISRTQALLFESGALGMEVKLEKSGFIPGEKVHIEAKLSNESDKEVRVTLFLLQETTYLAKERKVTDSEVIVSVEGPIIKPLGVKLWAGNLIQIPLVPFPYLQNSHLIACRYRFVIEMEIPTPNINLEGTIPIIIGTIQLNEGMIAASALETRVNKDTSEEGNLNNSNIISNETTFQEGNNTKTDGNNQKKRQMRSRQKRPQTTCLVFRPDRPRVNLPTPKPDTWKKPIPVMPISEPSVACAETDTRLDGLEDDMSDMLVLIDKDKKHKQPPQFTPESPGEIHNNPKPKWPDSYIRKKVGNDVPPQKPARLLKTNRKISSGIPPFLTTDENSDTILNSGAISSEKSESHEAENKKATLPYPIENSENFPLPDFAFNISVDGGKRQPIGWNVTRNTLTLKRAKIAAGFVLPLPSVGWSSDPQVE